MRRNCPKFDFYKIVTAILCAGFTVLSLFFCTFTQRFFNPAVVGLVSTTPIIRIIKTQMQYGIFYEENKF
ncbi:hypothetical protein C7N43_32925 [Sphingobacteriales bacterium UPWRP_1]|nr:hypothetical protein BVG80_01220 [Sphingobacteriales bacterium TSM_CSM]PSJ72700.1 hypothetical protein C7N43_32925 [Sphingobacteriales bacterium UPWRP_1]